MPQTAHAPLLKNGSPPGVDIIEYIIKREKKCISWGKKLSFVI